MDFSSKNYDIFYNICFSDCSVICAWARTLLNQTNLEMALSILGIVCHLLQCMTIADYIKPLLDYAIQYVPPANRPYTPVFILATAGMRLVPIE